MRDLGTPVYPESFFSKILERFPDSTWITTVYRDSEPVASGFLAGFREMMEIPWASSVKKYNSSSPNMLLYWKALEFSIAQGFKCFDFGRSSAESGTFRFKKQWGAEPHQLYWRYWLKNGAGLPEINPDNPKFKTFIGIWQKLPVWLTRVIGPSIVKNLP
jgi:FemAB-related protein (PEP-CTERM system-associated)